MTPRLQRESNPSCQHHIILDYQSPIPQQCKLSATVGDYCHIHAPIYEKEKRKKDKAAKEKPFRDFCKNQKIAEEVHQLANPGKTNFDDLAYANGFFKKLVSNKSTIDAIKRFLLEPNHKDKLSIEDCEFILENKKHSTLMESVGKKDTTIEEAKRLVEKYLNNVEATKMIIDGISEQGVDTIIQRKQKEVNEAKALERKIAIEKRDAKKKADEKAVKEEEADKKAKTEQRQLEQEEAEKLREIMRTDGVKGVCSPSSKRIQN